MSCDGTVIGAPLAGESIDDPVIGRLVDRGLDDELKGTAYAVVDGTDGRTHHIKLADLDAAGDNSLSVSGRHLESCQRDGIDTG